MRPPLAAVLLACGVLIATPSTPRASAAPVPKALTKQNRHPLVGTWKPDSGTEWFGFDAEGGMRAWSTGREASPVHYTYAFDPDPDAREWRMTFTERGRDKPSFQAVFEVDGDRLKLRYSSVSSTPLAKPDPDTTRGFTAYTRQPPPK